MANTFWEKDFLIMCSYMSQSADCFMHSGFLLHIISNYALQILCGSPHKICNEEGKVNGLTPNRAVYDEHSREMQDVICGKFFIVYAPFEAEKFQSLPPDLAEKYREKFKYPECFMRVNNEIIAVPFKPVRADKER